MFLQALKLLVFGQFVGYFFGQVFDRIFRQGFQRLGGKQTVNTMYSTTMNKEKTSEYQTSLQHILKITQISLQSTLKGLVLPHPAR